MTAYWKGHGVHVSHCAHRFRFGGYLLPESQMPAPTCHLPTLARRGNMSRLLTSFFSRRLAIEDRPDNLFASPVFRAKSVVRIYPHTNAVLRLPPSAVVSLVLRGRLNFVTHSPLCMGHILLGRTGGVTHIVVESSLSAARYTLLRIRGGIGLLFSAPITKA